MHVIEILQNLWYFANRRFRRNIIIVKSCFPAAWRAAQSAGI